MLQHNNNGTCTKYRSSYVEIIVESYWNNRDGKSTLVSVRPIPNQVYSQALDVKCSRQTRESYPVGTRFRALVKLTSREGNGEYLCARNNELYPLKEDGLD